MLQPHVTDQHKVEHDCEVEGKLHLNLIIPTAVLWILQTYENMDVHLKRQVGKKINQRSSLEAQLAVVHRDPERTRPHCGSFPRRGRCCSLCSGPNTRKGCNVYIKVQTYSKTHEQAACV